MTIPNLYGDPIACQTHWSQDHIDHYCDFVRQIKQPAHYIGLFGPQGQQERITALNLPRHSKFSIYMNDEAEIQAINKFMILAEQCQHEVEFLYNQCIIQDIVEPQLDTVYLNLDVYNLKDIGINYLKTLRELGKSLRSTARDVVFRVPTYNRGTGHLKTRAVNMVEAFHGKPVESILKGFSRRYGKRIGPQLYYITARSNNAN